MVKTDNPAGRLYEILSKAREQHTGQHTVNVWRKILKAENDRELYARLFYLKELIAEVEELVKARPDMRDDLYLKDYKNIHEAVDISHLNGNWGSVHARLDDTTMTSLAYISAMLSGQIPEQPIEEDALDELHDKIDSLYETIRESDLEASFKKILLAQLETLRRSIVEYEIRGTAGLKEALASSLGHLLYNYEQVQNHRQSPLWEKFITIFCNLDNIVSKALRYKGLGEKIIKLIGLDGPDS